MADPLKLICDELGVCKEEALFYLEGFRWDLNAAMEACRTKTLPSPAQPPSENQRTAAEEQRRNEKIARFIELSHGSSSVADATKYLSDNNWSLEHAARAFCEHRFDKPEKKSQPVPLSHDGDTEPWYLHGFSGNEGSADTMDDVWSKVPPFRHTSTNVRIGSPPPSASTPPLELKPESIKQFRDLLPEAPSQAVIDCLNHCKGNVKNAISYFNDGYSKSRSGIATAQVVKKFSGMAVDQDSSTESPLVEESSSPTQTRELLNSLKQDELIDIFVDAADGVVTRDIATIYLKASNWNIEQAFSCLVEEDKTTPVQEDSQEVETGSSSRDLPLPSMGSLPSQSQFESSYVSSGPTETQKSLEEAGEGDVTVAVPGMASSQVNDKAVEEGSSAETVPDPFANRDRTTVETQAAPSTIMITIRLADGIGTTLELPFRSNQTISDIRNAIDQRYPDNDRGYNLQSMDGVDYMDWNVTVYRVTRHDSRTLMQIYP
ncbi:uncharacterized protein LOC111215588 [Brassica napus]|uniref:uncharacterized protein LOC111215588 n=1 Tax=Brassica napus TaxID=3708 RepID=UPI002078D147|nr:uncharacterized protein LOC111215588 [Brassica napus]